MNDQGSLLLLIVDESILRFELLCEIFVVLSELWFCIVSVATSHAEHRHHTFLDRSFSSNAIACFVPIFACLFPDVVLVFELDSKDFHVLDTIDVRDIHIVGPEHILVMDKSLSELHFCEGKLAAFNHVCK